MGREFRKVPADWQHPRDSRTGHFTPLMDGYEKDAVEFKAKMAAEGLQAAIDYFGQAPDQNNYMPDWPESERTHLMMYEDCSEGTPISPAFVTPEELAHWLADNKASSFGSMTATYEQWLNVCRGAFAVSMVIDNGVMKSGVEFASETP